MLTVHHLGISQSDRIVWLCEELGIAYDLKRYDRDPTTRLAPPEYQALHLIGTGPIITDGDVVLGESVAIVEYIIAGYGDGRLTISSDHATFADYLFWFHFANGSFMPATMMGLLGGLASGGGEPLKGLNRRGDRAWAMVEARVAETPYLAGDVFTAADIMTLFPLTTMRFFAPRDISTIRTFGPICNGSAPARPVSARWRKRIRGSSYRLPERRSDDRRGSRSGYEYDHEKQATRADGTRRLGWSRHQ